MPERQNHVFIIFLLWSICTLLNVTKAVHIDDTVSLIVAQQIREHPLRPYSGYLNWSDGAGPTATISQPPLLFAIFAASFALWGESIFAAHLIMSLFTLGVIICFFLLARYFAAEHAVGGLLLFILGPSFIPSQNLMTDVPTLFFWLLFFLFLLPEIKMPQIGSSGERNRFLLAGAASGLACLTKYISAILPPIFVFATLMRRPRSFLGITFIPFFILLLWLCFSRSDYGGYHLFSKIEMPVPLTVLHKACDYLVCLGGVSLFSPLFLPALLKKRRTFAVVISLIVLGYVFYPVSFLPQENIAGQQRLFIRTFWLNGIFTLSSTLLLPLQQIERASFVSYCRSPLCLLYSWIIGNLLFIILFAPFIAVRHLLPAIPAFILILSMRCLPVAPKSLRWSTLLFSSVFGILLSISDWIKADLYRDTAYQIRHELGENAKIIALGHWGWQWYADKVGMIIYDRYSTILQAGEFVVIPEQISHQEMRPEHTAALNLIRTIEPAATPLTWIRTMAFEPLGGFYSQSKMLGPWRFSRRPLDRFAIYAVGDPSTKGDSPNRSMQGIPFSK